MVLKPKTIVTKVGTAYAVPPMLAPKEGKDHPINNNAKEIKAEKDVKHNLKQNKIDHL